MFSAEEARKRREQLNRRPSKRMILRDLETVEDKPKKKEMDDNNSPTMNNNGDAEQTNNNNGGPQPSNSIQQLCDSPKDCQFLSNRLPNLIGNLSKSAAPNPLPSRVNYNNDYFAHSSTNNQFVSNGVTNLIGNLPKSVPANSLPPGLRVELSATSVPNQIAHLSPRTQSHFNLGQINLLAPTPPQGRIIAEIPSQPQPQIPQTGNAPQPLVSVGIDLGTNNSCLAVWRNGKVDVIANEDSNLTATCVSFKPGEDPIVGNCTRKDRLIHPENTIFEMKRLFGRNFNESFVNWMKQRWPFKIVDDGHGKLLVELKLAGNTKHIRPVDIQAMVLKNIRKRAEHLLGHPIAKAVITVPVNFNDDAKSETMETARIAGFDNCSIQLLHEPTAAAYYYGYCAQRQNDYTLLVFDMGGGYVNIGIYQVINNVLIEKAIDGINDLGGSEFDSQLFGLAAKKIMQKYGSRHNVHRDKSSIPYLLAQCQAVKKRLSTNNVARLDVSEVFHELDEVIIERDEYEELIQPLVDRMMQLVRKLMAETKFEQKDINQVLLVGGSSRLPIIQRILKAEFGDVNLSLNPDEAIAQGAAIFAGIQCMNGSSNLELIGGGPGGRPPLSSAKRNEKQQNTTQKWEMIRPNDSPYIPPVYLRTDFYERLKAFSFPWKSAHLHKDDAIKFEDGNYMSCEMVDSFFRVLRVQFYSSESNTKDRIEHKNSTGIIYWPYHYKEKKHFALMRADTSRKEICYYDSLVNYASDQIENAMQQFLQRIGPRKPESWQLRRMKCPQQTGGVDCGIFTCLYAKFLNDNKKVEFSMDEIPFWRRFILYSIVGEFKMPTVKSTNFYTLVAAKKRESSTPTPNKSTKKQPSIHEELEKEAQEKQQRKGRKSKASGKMAASTPAIIVSTTPIQSTSSKTIAQTKATTPSMQPITSQTIVQSTRSSRSKSKNHSRANSASRDSMSRSCSISSTASSNYQFLATSETKKIESEKKEKKQRQQDEVITTEEPYQSHVGYVEDEDNNGHVRVRGYDGIEWNADHMDVNHCTQRAAATVVQGMTLGGMDEEQIKHSLRTVISEQLQLGFAIGLNEMEMAKKKSDEELKKRIEEVKKYSDYNCGQTSKQFNGESTIRSIYEKERRKKQRQIKRQNEAKKKAENKQNKKIPTGLEDEEEEIEPVIKKTKPNKLEGKEEEKVETPEQKEDGKEEQIKTPERKEDEKEEQIKIPALT